MKRITEDTIDLSEYLDSNFYDPVWYWDTLGGEKGKALPVICIGISQRIGAGMCHWVLKKQGNVISQYMVQHVTKEDILNSKLKETLELAYNNIKEKLVDEKHELESCPENKLFHEDIILDEKEERELYTEIPEADDYTL